MERDTGLEIPIVTAIRRILRAVEMHSRQLVEERGITAPQLAILAAAHEERHPTIGALARAAHLSQPTVSGILDRLERDGLVRRRRSDRDRRQVGVVVTEPGEKLLRETPSLLQDRFRRELGRLEQWERHALLAALERVAAMMDAEELDASPYLQAGPIRGAALAGETQEESEES